MEIFPPLSGFMTLAGAKEFHITSQEMELSIQSSGTAVVQVFLLIQVAIKMLKSPTQLEVKVRH